MLAGSGKFIEMFEDLNSRVISERHVVYVVGDIVHDYFDHIGVDPKANLLSDKAGTWDTSTLRPLIAFS